MYFHQPTVPLHQQKIVLQGGRKVTIDVTSLVYTRLPGTKLTGTVRTPFRNWPRSKPSNQEIPSETSIHTAIYGSVATTAMWQINGLATVQIHRFSVGLRIYIRTESITLRYRWRPRRTKGLFDKSTTSLTCSTTIFIILWLSVISFAKTRTSSTK